MALRKIVLDTDELLRKKSRPVVNFDQRLWELLDDMAQTMHKADGVGLAAPQVGILRRAVVVDVGDGVIELINPVIVSEEGAQSASEGCLSSPEVYMEVTRPMKVSVKACDRYGKEKIFSGSELLARAFCHEVDHLNGVLFMDRADGPAKEKTKR